MLDELILTPRSKKVLGLAITEVYKVQHRYIGGEHILLGLIREGEGIAAGILESFGINLEKLYAEVLNLLKTN